MANIIKKTNFALYPIKVMDVISPFEYNKPVTGEHFIGREKEVAKLKGLIKLKKNALLYGPPKIGKRSIVYNAISELLKEKHPLEVCAVDLFNIRCLEDLLIKIASTLLQHFATTVQEREYLQRSYLKTISLVAGRGISFTDKQLRALLAFPEQVANEYNANLVIYLQQFQDILLFDKPLRALSLMENALTRCANVCYIIVGDKRNAMDSIFMEKQFFRNIITEIPIKPINKKIFCDYISERFKQWGKIAEEAEAGQIYDSMEGDPWYVQHLAEVCFLYTSEKLTPEIVAGAIENLMTIHDYEWHNNIYGLSTHQVQLIKAILDGVRKFSKTEILEHYHLNSSANVNRLKEALTKKEIVTFVGKNVIEFNDSLFKLWLIKHFFVQ